MAGDTIIEREWTDKRGTFYEVRGVGVDGLVYSLRLVMNPVLGWPVRRKTAYDEVKRALLRAQLVHEAKLAREAQLTHKVSNTTYMK